MKAIFFFILCLVFLCFAQQAWAADITANTVLKRGTIITNSNVSIKPGAGENIASIRNRYIGQQLTRTVYAGHKVEAHYLSPPVLVKRNSQVSMVYTFGAMRLSAKGRALQAGARGDTIAVMNISSRKKITAVILASNLVEVSG